VAQANAAWLLETPTLNGPLHVAQRALDDLVVASQTAWHGLMSLLGLSPPLSLEAGTAVKRDERAASSSSSYSSSTTLGDDEKALSAPPSQPSSSSPPPPAACRGLSHDACAAEALHFWRMAARQKNPEAALKVSVD